MIKVSTLDSILTETTSQTQTENSTMYQETVSSDNILNTNDTDNNNNDTYNNNNTRIALKLNINQIFDETNQIIICNLHWTGKGNSKN